MAKCIFSSVLVKPGEYSLALAKGSDNVLANIGSDDALRLTDVNTLKVLNTAAGCHAGVACLEAGARSQFLTSGRDGLVRCWDSRAKRTTEMMDPKSNGISSLACHDHYVAAGTESLKEGLGDVSVLVFDLRKTSAPLRQYIESHTDTLTQLQFHPDQPHILLSASTDGLVSLFDVNHNEEDDALQQVLNPRSAVHCAGFLAQDQVYIVSTDEQYSIHTLPKTASDDEQLPPPLQFGDVRDKLDCMYVIDVLVQPAGPALMAYGHNEKQTLRIASLGSPGAWGFGQLVDLPGAHGEEVVRDLIMVDQRAFSCGEDGCVKAWALV